MGRTSTSTSQTVHALLGLREIVLNGEFERGARLPELSLVERLGVSRTPVRLALVRLEHEGLLRALPSGGYAVREFTQSDIADAVELRGVLEGTAARFAAERGATQRELRALRAVSDEIAIVVRRADYESFERYVGLNETFHAKLLDMAASPLLQRAVEGITALPFASPSAFVFSEAQLPESREILVTAHGQHCAMIEAIERRESTRAEAIGREHARVALTNLQIVMSHGGVPMRVPGGSLISLQQQPEATQGRGRSGIGAFTSPAQPAPATSAQPHRSPRPQAGRRPRAAG
jgi:GntR family transcriptional regulator of vanillate catabolism